MTAQSLTKIYGTTWCGDCHRAKKVFNDLSEPYDWIDVDADDEARAHVVSVVGKVKVPLIVFNDGSHLVEPSNDALREKIHLVRGGVR